MENIKSILIVGTSRFLFHRANNAENRLGNETAIKKTNDNRSYISGQMIRYSLFESITRLNMDDPKANGSFVGNPDGNNNDIKIDLRADLGGFFVTRGEGTYGEKRLSPISVTPAYATQPLQPGKDLLLRFRRQGNEDGKPNAIAHVEYSNEDEFIFNFHLDVASVGTTKNYVYDKDSSEHVRTEYSQLIDDEEIKRRVEMFVEAATSLHDFASQARNAVSAEFDKVLIVFDTKISRKAMRYYHPGTTEQQRENMLKEIKKRGGLVFQGDDDKENSVGDAIEQALTELDNSTLYKLKSQELSHA